MCGIIGIFKENSESLVRKGMKLMSYRGRDGSGISSEKDYCLGHVLHSIVGNKVKQPFSGKFVANCEIYNWKSLGKGRNDAEVLFKLLEKEDLKKVLKKLDGVYAFAYIKDDYLYLVRDLIGIKPLFYNNDKKNFAFASEKKVLEGLEYNNVEELNPRQILKYNIKTKKITFLKRGFFKITPEHKQDYKILRKNVENLLIKAIKKRVPNKKFGLLFSGGIDSVVLAYYLKKLGYDFTCYTSVLKHSKESTDLIYAKKVAKDLGLKLKYREVEIEKVPSYLEKIVPLIEDNNPVKVSIALTFFTALELAKKDNIKVILTGLGAEEIFAGYARHRVSKEINKECLSGLLKVYEKDSYRDDVITMYNNMELRIPFLDKELVDYSLKIPAKYKITSETDKFILRELGLVNGIPLEYAFRPKKATQYGSKFDWAIEKLAKGKKSNYLSQFYSKGNVRLGVLFSSGKDSCYAAEIMRKQNYDLSCLITIKSSNKDSYMYHTPNVDLVSLQSEAMEIPLIKVNSSGLKEDEVKDLEKALIIAKRKFGISGVVSGALYSNYQRTRIEKVCDNLGLKVFSPLWHKDQAKYMKELVNNGYKFVFSSIAADGLDESWLGREISLKDIDKLIKLHSKNGLNVAGEGGEFESLVLDCPLFKKKIKIVDSEVIMENEYTGKFIIKKAKL